MAILQLRRESKCMARPTQRCRQVHKLHSLSFVRDRESASLSRRLRDPKFYVMYP
ncbi:hypothetical protein RSAG8_06066, partial [Rhizoctonia solani AG-8 WAC10335]